MSNVIEIKNDTLYYIKGNDDNIIGVGDSDCSIELINMSNDLLAVSSEYGWGVEKHKFKQLCIAWLLLNYPNTINSDIDLGDKTG